MVQNNKVLTVSYGTFSCTLEGFDDSFETMKAIAEYFRDLAAEDRYFGSEPPQPDAEMLARIAQRDTARHVEARPGENGVLLRASNRPPSTASSPMTADTRTPSMTPPLPDPQDPVARAPAADSIAAKLQRIRAVVSHGDHPPAPYTEEDETGFLAATEPQVDAISAAFASGALAPDDLETEAASPRQPDIPSTAGADPIKAQPDAHVDSAAETGASIELADQTDVDSDLPPQAADADDDLSVEPPQAEAAVTVDDGSDEMVPEARATTIEPEAEVEEALFEDLEDDAQPDVDDILNILSEDDADEATGTLTVEDEENILREISAIESEMETPADHADDDELDTDVLRLLQKADAELDDPATADTRETYSHLRTAVAATEAEREASGDDTAAEDEKYRGDLASVVSPRRPEIQVTSMRPESDKAAPLKLVAEQRVDTDAPEAGPVTPRRVTAEAADSTPDEGGFARFAQEQSAQSLPELLEAAAAYLSFIEGQEQFSRPQLMNKVRALKQDEFNREESLRSFGQLLRDGKIEKAGGGRFAASNQIGFRPEDKRAAG
ncbi:hypothetical protein SAMN05444279_11367 [Ruegeria intermedia]|uniref:Chemotaxis protein CheA n=1 Tax=Ruegeria intermedia TaxID=996115 RepID=A0A1M4XYT2_9RHOB|nr:hypothetical protein [Ruegeria intermedia]SHE98717.1 hypothetical protein SAMN05444279_11367 [Ruegeria intermedia]